MTKPFAMNYRTYDDSKGRGNAREWRSNLNARMSLDEATRRVGADTPEAILGVRSSDTWDVIKSAFRAKAHACHPDRCAFHGLSLEVATERFKQLTAAFTLLAHRRGR